MKAREAIWSRWWRCSPPASSPFRSSSALGLGSILGYLAAGLVIGPFGLGIFYDSAAILHVAELGVVMFLFIIGLEMEPSRLWSLRREIFGLGVLQVGVCALLLTSVGIVTGFPDFASPSLPAPASC